ncbi:MAG: hypothetical protein DRO95_00140 [Candidatus Altiarchaeales archaeon]|nr:MAG: hypothetical protein DRO95_00140 [Candidatus Altiarchaeales archaeon]HDO82789.1 hypothetical protein [Candidatus Altiarchaeales archaeon]HEX55438.1 hypothetical protein [Candidatus Altiarchaeales archaeon]
MTDLTPKSTKPILKIWKFSGVIWDGEKFKATLVCPVLENSILFFWYIISYTRDDSTASELKPEGIIRMVLWNRRPTIIRIYN